MLVSDVMTGLGMVIKVVVLLRGVMRVMGLRLKFRDLHAKALVGLATIHHDMLSLVVLVHVESIQGHRLIGRR